MNKLSFSYAWSAFFLPIAFALLLSLMLSASAEIPHLISYQGRLTDDTGMPITGSHNITFALYDAEIGGVPLWVETHSSVFLNDDGLYNVMLGSVTPFPPTASFDRQYWLGISVDGGAEICRYALAASPYAFNIASMNAADGQVLKWNEADSSWKPANDQTGANGAGVDNSLARWRGTDTLESSIIFQSDSNYIGIGTTVPEADLHIAGDGDASIRLDATDGYNSKIDMYENGIGKWRLISRTEDTTDRFEIMEIGVGAHLIVDSGGKIGIGTTAPHPNSKVDIYHSAPEAAMFVENQRGGSLSYPTTGETMGIYATAASSEPENKYAVCGVAGGDAGVKIGIYGSATGAGTNWAAFFYGGNVYASDNVGIGTTTPSWKLTVNGDAAKPGGGSWIDASDLRLKNIHGSFTRGLSAIERLNPMYFSYKSDNPLGLPDDRQYVGLVAQDVAEVIPEAIRQNGKDEYLYLNNDPIIWAMLNAIKELKAQNDSLKERLNRIEKKCRVLEQ